MRTFLSALSGGVTLAILFPSTYWVLFSDGREDLMNALPLLLLSGFILGAVLGARYPRLYEEISDFLTDL